MADIYNVRVTVISQKGHCDLGHKVGDQWVIDGKTLKTTEGLCLFAYQSFQSMLVALMFGGVFPWEKDTDTVSAVCPDPNNSVVFELRRLRE